MARALEALPEAGGADTGSDRGGAVRDMLEFAARHNFTLGEGLRLRDLIGEGRG